MPRSFDQAPIRACECAQPRSDQEHGSVHTLNAQPISEWLASVRAGEPGISAPNRWEMGPKPVQKTPSTRSFSRHCGHVSPPKHGKRSFIQTFPNGVLAVGISLDCQIECSKHQSLTDPRREQASQCGAKGIEVALVFVSNVIQSQMTVSGCVYVPCATTVAQICRGGGGLRISLSPRKMSWYRHHIR